MRDFAEDVGNRRRDGRSRICLRRGGSNLYGAVDLSGVGGLVGKS